MCAIRYTNIAEIKIRRYIREKKCTDITVQMYPYKNK